MYKLIYEALKWAYNHGGRERLVEAIDNPDSVIDDIVVAILDKLLDYQP